MEISSVNRLPFSVWKRHIILFLYLISHQNTLTILIGKFWLEKHPIKLSNILFKIIIHTFKFLSTSSVCLTAYLSYTCFTITQLIDFEYNIYTYIEQAINKVRYGLSKKMSYLGCYDGLTCSKNKNRRLSK